MSRVYPRAYGGTAHPRSTTRHRCGLSPRVRGNLRFTSRSPVYPRAYGGTGGSMTFTPRTPGLSPRVRGNQGYSAKQHSCSGSIPARTGEPSAIGFLNTLLAVYPRAYGGTQARQISLARGRGLSPRVRGNRRVPAGRDRNVRSIPARTGEPPRPRCCTSIGWVYPRAYGGTPHALNQVGGVVGLSPRVRGNRSPTIDYPP